MNIYDTIFNLSLFKQKGMLSNIPVCRLSLGKSTVRIFPLAEADLAQMLEVELSMGWFYFPCSSN